MENNIFIWNHSTSFLWYRISPLISQILSSTIIVITSCGSLCLYKFHLHFSTFTVKLKYTHTCHSVFHSNRCHTDTSSRVSYWHSDHVIHMDCCYRSPVLQNIKHILLSTVTALFYRYEQLLYGSMKMQICICVEFKWLLLACNILTSLTFWKLFCYPCQIWDC